MLDTGILGKVSISVHRTSFYPKPEEDGRLVFISLYLCSRQLYSVQLKLYCPTDLVDTIHRVRQKLQHHHVLCDGWMVYVV